MHCISKALVMELQNPIEIALADDHTLVRQGLKSLIELNKNYKVTMEAEHGMDLITQLAASKKLPDLCMIDLSMSPLNGYETVIVIKKKWPGLKTVMLSMYDHEVLVAKVMDAGAKSFMAKNITVRILHEAMDHVVNKGYYHTPMISEMLLRKESKTCLHITERELQFLCVCYKDLSYKEIASRMHVELRTVENYRDSLYHKLGIHSRAGLSAYARSTGLMDLTTDYLEESGLV